MTTIEHDVLGPYTVSRPFRPHLMNADFRGSPTQPVGLG